MRLIATATILCVLCARVVAEEGGMARGVGTASCAEYAKIYRNDPKLAKSIFGAWAQGFMSGSNTARLSLAYLPDYRDMNAKSLEQQDAHIRQYCDAHPLKDFGEAVIDFYETLPLRKPRVPR
jgi:hypothetical protein